MSIIENAVTVCNTAEKALRELMQKAISTAEYRHLPTLARMAEQIASLATRASQASDGTPEPAPVADPASQISARRPRGRPRNTATTKSNMSAPPRVRSSKKGYPRFCRTDDTLVKVGWSKKARKEYEHRAPRNAVEEVIKSVAVAGAKGAIFTVEALLPVHDKSDGTEIPGYQVYLALAWFRVEGIIRQHGRDGYSLLVADEAAKTVEQRWSALPTEKPERA